MHPLVIWVVSTSNGDDDHSIPNLGDMALAADAVVVIHAGETRLEEKGDGVCRRTPFMVTRSDQG